MDFLFGEVRMFEEKRYCNSCENEVSTMAKILSTGPHYSQYNCLDCGKFLGYGKKPGNENKRAKNKYTAEALGIDFCQMCLRKTNKLGSRGVLEVHHVEEINRDGADTPENIWVICTSCHKLIHHQRTYLNDHLKGLYTIVDLLRDMSANNVPADTQQLMIRIFKKQAEVDNAS
jgi:predicted RNA-binding Zn-ribbon protein involved in translation (DUF1610 family)